jgi:hypothetical protein
MEEGTIPSEVQAYHRDGFARLREQWDHYNQLLDDVRGNCIPFPSYEFHSFQTGDYTIIHKKLGIALPEAPTGGKDERLLKLLGSTDAIRDELICMPHHIGYKHGYRGIGWEFFHSKASPVIEIVSMHGSAESLEASPGYLHTMGPRSALNTMQGGLSLGHRFGVVGSSDHHNASPGSYGCGRTGLWSTDRSRDAIWAGLTNKQTLALTGDPMELMIFLNDMPMGSGYDLPGDGTVPLDAYVAGYTVLDRIEILKNNKVIHRVHPCDHHQPTQQVTRGFLDFAFGWGEKHSTCQWEATITIEKGIIHSTAKRLRGEDIVDPLDTSTSGRVLPHFTRSGNTVSLKVTTRGNPTATTDTTQGFALEIEGSEQSIIHLHAKGIWQDKLHQIEVSYPLSSLTGMSQVTYLNGFVSPAVSISQFHPIEQCMGEVHIEVDAMPDDVFYARVFTNHGDCAWSSPCWVR